jgi:hypothetical protein
MTRVNVATCDRGKPACTALHAGGRSLSCGVCRPLWALVIRGGEKVEFKRRSNRG